MKSKSESSKLFDLPPKCPAIAGKLSGLFGWRHTYKVHQRQKGISHFNYNLQKSYSLNLPPKKLVFGAGEAGSSGSLAEEKKKVMFGGFIFLES